MKSIAPVCLFLLLGALSGCKRPAPDAQYLQAVDQAAELLDNYGGDREDLARADTLLSKAMSDRPDLPHAYVESARLVIKGGHISYGNFTGGTLEAATSLLDEAERLDPDYCESYSLRGHVLTLTRQFDAALAALDRADALDCPNPWRFANRADALVKMNRLADAEAVLRKIADRGPGKTTRDRNVYSSAMSDLTSIALSRGEYDAARDLVHKELEIARPDHPWDYSEAANKLIFTGDFDESIALCRRALEVFEFGVAHATMATAQYGKSIEIQARIKKSEGLSESERQALQLEADTLWNEASAVHPDFREAASRLWQSRPNRDLEFRAILTERANQVHAEREQQGAKRG